MSPILKTLAVLATALALGGCTDQELYGRLGETQVNEMVALLQNAGISAAKRPGDGGHYSLDVAPADFAAAVEVLRSAGYPHEEHDNLGQVFRKDGFVTTELEERARFMHALSQELSTTLQSIDGVILARVHLSVPEKRRFAEQPSAAAASVFIKHRAGMDMSAHTGSIKALVVNAVEGLPYDAVTVVTFPAEPWPGGATAARQEAAPVLAGLSTPLVALAAAGLASLFVGGGLWLWQRRRGPVPTPGDTRVAQRPGRHA